MKDRVSLDDPNFTEGVVPNNKPKVLCIVLFVIAAIVVIAANVLQNGNGGGNSATAALDPNRTWEPCSRNGETRVFGSQHDTTICYPDADGYYHITLGHHHHK